MQKVAFEERFLIRRGSLRSGLLQLETERAEGQGGKRPSQRGDRKEAGMTAAVIYNNRIKQIRANQPAHEYIMLPRLIYDYNVRV